MKKIPEMDILNKNSDEKLDVIDEELVNLDEIIKNWVKVAHKFNELYEKELRDESCSIVQSLLQMRTSHTAIKNC